MSSHLPCPSCSVQIYIPDLITTGACPLCQVSVDMSLLPNTNTEQDSEKNGGGGDVDDDSAAPTVSAISEKRNKSKDAKSRIIMMMIQEAASKIGITTLTNKDVTQIRPNIFVGNLNSALDRTFLRNYNIQYILNCAVEIPSFFNTDNFSILKSLSYDVDTIYDTQKNEKEITYLHLPLVDSEDENISDYFDSTYDFLTRDDSSNILIHCAQGASRSVTIAAAFLMRSEKRSSEEVLNEIKKCREIHPNNGFITQLKEWEIKVKEFSHKVNMSMVVE